jgi:UDP-N-acetyl-D-mannosaminuronic acid transferase (WecB/TagA/CpsF family)
MNNLVSFHVCAEFNPSEVISSCDTKLVTFVNPYSYYLVREFLQANQFDYVYSDAISFVKIHNLLNPNLKIKRHSFDFTSLAPVVFDYCQRESLKLGLVGGSSEEISGAFKVIKSRYPSLDIVYCRDGYFNSDCELSISLKELKDLQVEVLICGMGTPLQENFLIKAKESNVFLKCGFTCGGFLTQIASREDYFNPILSKLNLRWAQRFYRHSFVRRRVLVDYPVFFVKYLFEKFLSFFNNGSNGESS